MTIAACYPSSEGVVFGADSTTTMFVSGVGNQPGIEHHYTFCQKVFEFGNPGSSLGIVTWGLGSLPTTSYRTLIAEAADMARNNNPDNLEKVVKLWAKMFWSEYVNSFRELLERINNLESKESTRTDDEEKEFRYWNLNLSGGFCIGGRWGATRKTEAFEVLFNPVLKDTPSPTPLVLGNPKFWGCPSLLDRLVLGIDPALFAAIIDSGKWQGTGDELFDIVSHGVLGAPHDLPIREAIDLVYAKIYTTNKAMKFSHLAPVCGGPIEIAVITSDRPFRWVCHKKLSEAISEGTFWED